MAVQEKVTPNRIQVRNGNSKPVEGDLIPNELGYQKSTGILYIGRADGSPIPVLTFTDPNGDGNIKFGLIQS